ncbi:MAG: glycosyltransferase [Candidatus Babeliaceae bacterium]|nr:glycosyltransferase [Candidatus Babeliaceae bacterium]
MNKLETQTAVVYIITKLELGGAQKVCLALFNGVDSKDYKTHLISGAEGVLSAQVKNNPHAYLLPTMLADISIFRLAIEIRNFFILIKQLRTLKRQYSNIIVHTHSTKAGIVGRWAAFFAGIRNIIHTVHGFAFHQFQSRLRWTALYIPELITSFITTKFIFVSQTDAQTALRLFPRIKEKKVLIRAAIDDRHFITSQKEMVTQKEHSRPFIIGTISCFKPQKNLLDLLKAFEHAYRQDQNIRLEIIGDGQQRPALEAFIDYHGLENIVTLHGWQLDVAPIMKRWHIFVLSSLWEGLPCAIIEARLLKLPIISYRIGGISDVIHHGVNGFLYDAINSASKSTNWQKLAEGILMLAHDQTLYATLAQYPDNLQYFTREDMIQKHRELYQQLQ